MILDAIQEAEIDGSSERIKKRRRITESGVVDSNVAALVLKKKCDEEKNYLVKAIRKIRNKDLKKINCITRTCLNAVP